MNFFLGFLCVHEFVKVSGGSRILVVCIKGFTFSHFSGKARAGAPDTRYDEAPPGKCKTKKKKKKIYIYIYIYMKRILCRPDIYIYIYIYINETHLMQARHIS